ncbi:Glycoside hydrolase 131 catalytic N-terminal domain-containing protein [Abortiporus biennis]
MLLPFLLALFPFALGTPVIWDGRAPFNLTNEDLNSSIGPFLTVVKGSENATHYTSLHGHSLAPTPLWNQFLVLPTEQVISVSIDNTSIFVPGGGAPQYGFRRTDIIAANDGEHTALITEMENGTTVFHFSVMLDKDKPLNFNHEYQIVFIEPNDGSHVFGIQLGSPFTNPTGNLPAPNAHSFKVLDHALNVLFTTPFTADIWHNFAVQVDWTNRTLGVFYSKNAALLKPVTNLVQNPTAAEGVSGQGDFHFTVLKLPLVNPNDSPANQGDVVHYGIQEGSTEGLLYSGVFVESVVHELSIGGHSTTLPIS